MGIRCGEEPRGIVLNNGNVVEINATYKVNDVVEFSDLRNEVQNHFGKIERVFIETQKLEDSEKQICVTGYSIKSERQCFLVKQEDIINKYEVSNASN